MPTPSSVRIVTRTALAFLLCFAFARVAIGDIATVTFDTNSLVQIYNGNPCHVTATTEPAGLSLEILYEGQANAPTMAGYYEVIATVTQSGWTGGATNYLAIDRAPQTVLFTLPGEAFATSSVPLSAVATSGQTPSFGVLSGPGVIVGSKLCFTNQGACIVMAWVSGNENWRDASATATVQVSRTHAVVALSNLTQSYDGYPIEPTVLTTPYGLAVAVTYDGSLVPPVNAGMYAVTALVTDLQWDGVATGLLTVARGEQFMAFDNPGICARTNVTELFAGTTEDFPATFTIVEGPVSVQTNDGRFYATFSSTGRVSIAASHPGTANWLPAPAVTNTFFVFENPIHIQIESAVFTYDGTPQAVRLIIPDGSGLTTNDISVTYSGSLTPPTDAGIYDLVALVTNPPSLQGGYVGPFTILKAEDEIEFYPPAEIVATQTLELVATSLSGRPCLFYVTPEHIADIEDESNLVFIAAGEALVCAYTEEEDPNWTDAESWEWITANKANIPVSLSNLLQPFDGTPRIVTAHADVPTVEITYDGSSQPPTAAGRYTVTGILSNPLCEGSATSTLIVLDRPETTISCSNGTLQFTWLAEPDLFYSIQHATPNLDLWNDLPPFTNLTGNGTLVVSIPATNAAHFRVVAF
jgi:hypothetical protein